MSEMPRLDPTMQGVYRHLFSTTTNEEEKAEVGQILDEYKKQGQGGNIDVYMWCCNKKIGKSSCRVSFGEKPIICHITLIDKELARNEKATFYYSIRKAYEFETKRFKVVINTKQNMITTEALDDASLCASHMVAQALPADPTLALQLLPAIQFKILFLPNLRAIANALDIAERLLISDLNVFKLFVNGQYFCK